MRHAATLALVAALAIGVIAPPAFPQDGVGVTDGADDAAESAFLRAYYQEKGLGDRAAAEKLYDAVVREHASQPGVVAKALLGRLRCLRALGRGDEADAVLRRLETDFADRTRLLDEARRTSGDAPRDVVEDVANRVVAALRKDDFAGPATAFGDPAVPTLARTLRVADPSLANRAAQVLVRIGTDDACDALAAALHDSAVIYRDQVVAGVVSARLAWLPDRLGRAIVASPDTAMRDRIFESARRTRLHSLQGWVMDALREHEWARLIAFPETLTRDRSTQLVVMHSLAEEPGPLRDAALAYVRRHDKHSAADWSVLRDAPPALLADEEALGALCEHVFDRYWRYEPGEKLRDALLRLPAHSAIALHWTWASRPKTPPDADLFLAALAKQSGPLDAAQHALSSRGVTPNSYRPQMARRLHEILGREPTTEQLRTLGSVWRDDDFSSGEYLDRLAQAGGATPARVQALYDGLSTTAQRRHVIVWLLSAVETIDDDRWAETMFSRAAKDQDEAMRFLAVRGLLHLHGRGSIDLTRYLEPVSEVATNWNDGVWIGPRAALIEMGPVGHRALAERLEPGSRAASRLIGALSDARASDAVPAIRRVLLAPLAETVAAAEPDPNAKGEDATMKRVLESKWAAAEALGRIQGPAARDALREALLQGGDVTRYVLRGASESADELGSETYASLLMEAFAKAEGLNLSGDRRVISGFHTLAPAHRRSVAIYALQSPHPTVRRWGAQQQVSLLDADATELLVGLISDEDTDTRKFARQALAAMRHAEAELAWLKSVSRRRETVARVEALLADGNPRMRQAGVAGLVATGSHDVVSRLLTIATDDPDPDVAAEARSALLALGRPIDEPDAEPAPK